MFFKNAILYRVHNAPDTIPDQAQLNEAAKRYPATDLNSGQPSRIGWTPPSADDTILAHEIQGHRLMAALHQRRILPASVVNEEVERRAKEQERDTGIKISRQDKVALKTQVYEELLAKALVRSTRIELWWDLTHRVLAINCANRKRAEETLDLLRQTMGSLKVTPLASKILPSRAMTSWLQDPDSRPDWLQLGDQTVLSDDEKSTFSARYADLDSDNVRQLISDGHNASCIALDMDGVASMVLTGELTLKKLRFADRLLEESQDYDDEDPIAAFETDLLVMGGALSLLVSQLLEALGGETLPSEVDTDKDQTPGPVNQVQTPETQPNESESDDNNIDHTE